jgi:hypothetical protein
VSDTRVDWTLAACARVIRPLVRMALAMGVKHRHLDEMLRNLLLEEARRSWREKGIEPNISQLSVTTGINRKAVTLKVREPDEQLPHTEMSAAAKTVTGWLQLIGESPGSETIPITSSGDGASFEALARHASRGNLHHRTILDELARLGMVHVEGALVTLKSDEFVPTEDLRSMLAFFGDNARDHLLAGTSNILSEKPLMLERAIFASGMSLKDCDAVQKLLRKRWGVLHRELAGEMTRSVTAAKGEGTARLRVGIYTYFEDKDSGSSAEIAPPP